jgi:hypothetical protein
MDRLGMEKLSKIINYFLRAEKKEVAGLEK